MPIKEILLTIATATIILIILGVVAEQQMDAIDVWKMGCNQCAARNASYRVLPSGQGICDYEKPPLNCSEAFENLTLIG